MVCGLANVFLVKAGSSQRRAGSGWPGSSGGRKCPAGEIQVCERQQREHLSPVLGDAAIAHLAIAELALNDAKHMLDSCAHLAEPVIAGTLASRQPAAGFGFLLHRPEHPRRLRGALLRIVGVALVAIHRGVVFADQTVHHLRIVNVAARHPRGVHEPAAGIDANVRLHAEVPAGDNAVRSPPPALTTAPSPPSRLERRRALCASSCPHNLASRSSAARPYCRPRIKGAVCHDPEADQSFPKLTKPAEGSRLLAMTFAIVPAFAMNT